MPSRPLGQGHGCQCCRRLLVLHDLGLGVRSGVTVVGWQGGGLFHAGGRGGGPITLPMVVIPLFLSRGWKDSRNGGCFSCLPLPSPGLGWCLVATSSGLQPLLATRPHSQWDSIAPRCFSHAARSRESTGGWEAGWLNATCLREGCRQLRTVFLLNSSVLSGP